MKRLFSFIISAVVFCSAFAFSVSADTLNEEAFNLIANAQGQDRETYVRQQFNIPDTSKIVFGHTLPDDTNQKILSYFIEIKNYEKSEIISDPTDQKYSYWQSYYQGKANYNLAAVVSFLDTTGQEKNVDYVYHTVKWSEGNGTYDIYQSTSSGSSTSIPLTTNQTSQYYRCITVDDWEESEFAHTPDTVFTYSIDKPNFTLQNNSTMFVRIEYTQEYLNWLRYIRQKFGSNINGTYNFCIYVSTVKPTDSASLVSSLDNSRYIKLQYGEYVYEGGVGYADLVSNSSESSEGEQPTSHSGKSPWTIAQGVHICTPFEPDLNSEQYSKLVDVKIENIEGFSEHTPLYVCVLGSYVSGNVSPNEFNSNVLGSALAGHSTPNDTYSEFYCEQSEGEGGSADYVMHTYYFPFECVNGCQGDGYQGNCEYKPQVVNGKSYNTTGKVTDWTNKSKNNVPDYLHDVDMDKNQWVKPEDYPKWQNDRYNKSTYDSEFDYNIQTFKNVLDKEGSFFGFLKSSFSVFPDYILNIFVGFIVCFLAIVLLKMVL